MTRIRCVILRVNRSTKILMKDVRGGQFRFSKGLYLMPKQYVSLASIKGVVKMIPELIYFENDPLPINITDREKVSGSFLDNVIIEKVLQATGKPSSMLLTVVAEYLRNPFKIITLTFALLISIVLLASALSGGII